MNYVWKVPKIQQKSNSAFKILIRSQISSHFIQNIRKNSKLKDKTQELGISLTPSCRNNGQKTSLSYTLTKYFFTFSQNHPIHPHYSIILVPNFYSGIFLLLSLLLCFIEKCSYTLTKYFSTFSPNHPIHPHYSIILVPNFYSGIFWARRAHNKMTVAS